MQITVVGSGYVGFTTGVCFANLGNDCTIVDLDKKRIDLLNEGVVPIYEPGIKDLFEINRREKRLNFTTDLASAVEKSEVIFICVGTPEGENGEVDMAQIYSAAEMIGKSMNGYKVIVNKSTVPVGTAKKVKEIIKKNYFGEFDVVSNPEFLREGSAVKDFFTPDRIIIGSEGGKAAEIIKGLYKGIERTESPIIITDTKSAELIKYASNSFLATKISFINEIARYAEVIGSDIKEITRGMGLDKRIGSRFLHAGIGYGGSCFPKDIKGLISSARKEGVELKILQSADDANFRQREIAIQKILKALGEPGGKTVAIWGLAFKPKTDDIRNAPAQTIIKRLIEEGIKVNAFDPVAEANFREIFPGVNYFSAPYDAAQNADLLFISTEWDQFRDIDKAKLRGLLKSPVIIDGRNIYEPEEMRLAGFIYEGFGRGKRVE